MKSRYFFQLVALSALWGTGFLLTRIATPVLGPSTGVAIRVSKKPVPHSADKATNWKKYRLFTGRVFRAR